MTRYRLRQKISFWLDRQDWLDHDRTVWIETVGNWLACKVLGHCPIPDQCLNPKHDYCAFCLKSMPGKA